MAERPRLYYGTCQGGPWNKRQMAHAVPTFAVYIDPHSKKAIPGLQAPTVAYPDVKRGCYLWDETAGWWEWKWDK